MTRPFRALLWKESLESLRHAAPVLLLSSLLFAGSLDGVDIGGSITAPFFWLHAYAAFVAAVIGVWQGRESSGDLWGFTMHRPVSPHAVVAAKVLVGIGAVLVAVGVPYALAMWWHAIPGNRAAPFDRSFWYPGIVDLISATMYYGAGLLAGSRRSPILVRAFAFAPALVGSIFVTTADSLTVALIIAVAVAAVLIAAAWSTFITGSDFDAQAPWGRAANVATALAASFVAVMVVALIIAVSLPEGPPRRYTTPLTPTAFVSGSGQLALLHPTPPNASGGGGGRTDRVTDVAGNRIPELEGRLGGPMLGSGVMIAPALPVDTLSARWGTPSTAPYREPRHWVTPLHNDFMRTRWFYERRSGLISIYDPTTKRLQGWVGPDGYSPYPTVPTRHFTGVFRRGTYGDDGRFRMLVLSDAVYRIDGLERPRLIFAAPPGETIFGADSAHWQRADNGPAPVAMPFALVATDKHAYVLDTAGKVEIVTRNEPTDGDWGAFVSATRAPFGAGQPTFLWYGAYASPTDTLRVLEFRNGSATPFARHVFAAHPWGENISTVAMSRMAAGRDVTFAPGPFSAFRTFSIRTRVPEEERAEAFRAVKIMLGVCLLLAAFAFWVCQRYAFSHRQTLLWTTLTAVTGPVALLSMLALLQWPARVPCPACRKARVVNRERCEHCNAPFTAPEPNGTEVFA